ncbi:MAG: Crp/Fnr family transcriptional regulator [Christensenellales bacterium]
MNKNKIVAILKNCPLFGGVSDDLITGLLTMEGFEQIKFSAGETVCPDCDAVGIVYSGSVHVVKRTADDRDVMMRTLMPSQVFGVATLFYRQGELSRIVARRDSAILFISRNLMEELFRREPLIVKNYITFLSGRIHFLNRKIEGFTGYGTKSRLALYFSDHAEENGNLNEVPLDCSLTELASVLNVGRASLYRALDGMAADGLIRREKKKIIILDADKLFASVHTKSFE